MKHILSVIVVFLLFLVFPSAALAADTWTVPVDTPTATFKTVKAAATLYYTDSTAGSDKVV
jgi:putative cell wall-binding protein